MSPDTLKLAVEVVTSYASHHTLPAAEVPGLIRSTYAELHAVSSEAALAEKPSPEKRPSTTLSDSDPSPNEINGLHE